MKKAIILFCSIIVLISNISLAKADEQKQLEQYVDNLMQETYEIFQDKNLTDYERKATAARIIKRHLHFDWMAKYSLGVYRRNLSKEKLQEFIKVYSDFIVNSYSQLALTYNGEKGVLTNIKRLGDDLFMVHTQIIIPKNNSSLTVDYLVHEINKNDQKNFLVGDIITEGISILNSQQSEFKSILSTGGIDALIENLKSKTVDN